MRGSESTIGCVQEGAEARDMGKVGVLGPRAQVRSPRRVGTESRHWFGEGVVGLVERRPMGHRMEVSTGWHHICFSGELGRWRGGSDVS